MEYLYDNLASPACVPYIQDYVGGSEMTDKVIQDISAHPVAMWVKVWFAIELSTGDKAILDAIVAGSVGKKQVKEKAAGIIAQVFQTAEPTTQLPRLLDVFDTNLTFKMALDAFNYPVASLRIAKLLSEAVITQEDADLVNGLIPDNYVDA